MSSIFTVKSSGVSSKVLYKEITDFLNEMISEFSVLYTNEDHRDVIISVIDEFMAEQHSDGKISQYNVICDKRNNTPLDRLEKVTILEVRYKQDNCYNVTILKYVIYHTVA